MDAPKFSLLDITLLHVYAISVSALDKPRVLLLSLEDSLLFDPPYQRVLGKLNTVAALNRATESESALQGLAGQPPHVILVTDGSMPRHRDVYAGLLDHVHASLHQADRSLQELACVQITLDSISNRRLKYFTADLCFQMHHLVPNDSNKNEATIERVSVNVSAETGERQHRAAKMTENAHPIHKQAPL